VEVACLQDSDREPDGDGEAQEVPRPVHRAVPLDHDRCAKPDRHHKQADETDVGVSPGEVDDGERCDEDSEEKPRQRQRLCSQLR